MAFRCRASCVFTVLCSEHVNGFDLRCVKLQRSRLHCRRSIVINHSSAKCSILVWRIELPYCYGDWLAVIERTVIGYVHKSIICIDVRYVPVPQRAI